jgi:hypothetical protein
MKQNLIYNPIPLLFCLCFTLSSCTARIDGSFAADGSVSLTVNISLMDRMAAMIQALSAAGGQPGALILDGPIIAQSISGAPGIASIILRNTSSSAVNGQVQISNINDFLSIADGRGFVNFSQSAGSGGRCLININRYNGAAILQLLSSEISDYLEIFMAPIVTGEEITKAEYLELVAGFYNRAIAIEIATSRIRATIDFPGQIRSVRGGTFTGRRVVFDIPLIDLLVLETPLSYEVIWN